MGLRNLCRVLGLVFIFISPASVFADLKHKSAEKVVPEAKVPFQFDYQFARPVKPGEVTYNIYRKRHMSEAAKMGLDPEAVGDGMDTWHWWVGVDNVGFWTDLVHLTGGAKNYTGLRIDLMRILMEVPRAERWAKLGLINDPDTVAADTPDQFGLKIDRMKDGSLQWDPEKFGYASGVIGLQIFKNEKFDPVKWSLPAYLANGSKVEPPYKVGMACAFCHISFNPLDPPADPVNPSWNNLTSTFGNQYLHEGMIFGLDLKDSSFVYHYLHSQEPGTSETSRFPTDSINNPTNINAILRLRERLKETHTEDITPAQADLVRSMYKNAGLKEDNITGVLGGTKEHPTMKAPHVLTDGADSMGILMASARVYVNEGMQHNDWYGVWPVDIFDIKKSLLDGFKPSEFDLMHKVRKDPNAPWVQTERRMPNMAAFLMSYDSFPLSAAPGGKKYLSTDEKVLTRGKIVFAENCASCHSSIKPDSMPASLEDQKKEWRKIVLKPDFLRDNYLSDDERHSVLEIGTNIQRAEGTNAQAGWTWGQMSSQTYKDQRKPMIDLVDHAPDGSERPLYNPLTQKYDIHFKGHAAFYRTPTLVSIWATAPYFHNNSLGQFYPDPSVEGRMKSYEDGMEKMLWPEKRLGVKSIKVTTTETNLPDLFPGLKQHLKKFDDMDLRIMNLPAGTPVNLLMNVNPKFFPQLLEAYMKGVLAGKSRSEYKSLIDRRRAAGMEALKNELIKVNTCPDFIEDRGHTFGAQLSDSDKKALIEYMKYF